MAILQFLWNMVCILLFIIPYSLTINIYDDYNNNNNNKNNNNNNNNNDMDRLEKLLKNDRLQFDEMMTTYVPIIELWEEIWENAQLSQEEKWDSLNKYPSKMSLNNLIGSIDNNDIEVILSENDIELTEQLTNGFESELKKSLKDIDLSRYWQFLDEMNNINRRKYDSNERRNFYKKKSVATFNINGASSDYRYLSSNVASTGMNGEYWSVSHECIKRKGCNVYPIFRVIHKTKQYKKENNNLSFSCNDILTILLPQIYECVDKNGIQSCPLIIDQGHFRWVFKAKIPNSNEYVVIKMMKQKQNQSPRDLMRHLRESIFLYYLRNEELKYIEKYSNFTNNNKTNKNNLLFKSNLNELRAFPFVYELGHCIYPSYISVSHFYDMTIEKFIDKQLNQKTTISKLIKMSLDIAKGIELLHNIPGGPYHHTDIRDDQFMIDQYGNVLINDFNRGKFQPYFFPKYDYNLTNIDNIVEKCNFCPHSSSGNLRAPEEHEMMNLDETIDIYSAALIIWSLFSNERPFEYIDSDNNNIQYLISMTNRRPPMTSNIPYALKDVIRSALSNNPKDRPNAKTFRKQIENIYKNLKKYTRNSQNLASHYVRQHKLFKDHHYPRIDKHFPEFNKKSKSDESTKT